MAAGFCLACRAPNAAVEQHHVLGRVNSELIVSLCRPHHREATEYLRAGGVSMNAAADGFDRVFALVLGLAVLAEMSTRGGLMDEPTTRLARAVVSVLSLLRAGDIDSGVHIPTTPVAMAKWSIAFERDLAAFLLKLAGEMQSWTR